MKKHPYLYSCILIAIVWELASLLISEGFFPPPYDTAVYFVQHLQMISLHLLMSFLRIFAAIAITVLAGSATGIFTARNAGADALVSPLLYTLYPVPKIAFLPLLMLFLGLGNGSKIALVSLILYFQIAISARDSVKNVHPAYFISIRSLGATKFQIYRHVILPAILPNLFTALRISVGTSISVLFFAENFATEYGIGYYIMDSWMRLDYTAMFAGIIAISLMGSVLFKLIDYAEIAVCRWKSSAGS
ncbi:MAG: ABC transporter permease [Saccharofermentanales bacterium]